MTINVEAWRARIQSAPYDNHPQVYIALKMLLDEIERLKKIVDHHEITDPDCKFCWELEA